MWAAPTAAAACLAALVAWAVIGAAAASAATQTFAAVADSYVYQSSPTTNYGTSTRLNLQDAPIRRGYVRFDVRGVTGAVTKATLRLKATSSSSTGLQVRAVSDNTWGEKTIKYANAPTPASTVTASSGAFSSGQWVSVDVTPLVRGDGLLSIALTRAKSTSISVASREAGTTSAPQLVVDSTPDTPPVNTSPPELSGTPRAGETLATSTGGWSGAAPITFGYSWLRCDPLLGGCAEVPGATDSTYLLGPADIGTTLHATVTASNDLGESAALSSASATISSAPDPTADPVIAAAGDIACDPADSSYAGGAGTSGSCRQLATSSLLDPSRLTAVLTLGDNQYDCGAPAAFLQSYDPTWGQFKSMTRPVPGNHEYQSSGSLGCAPAAAGYFAYFGQAAGPPGLGFYSYDIGAWHVIALNSNCSAVSCAAGSAQEQWLRADLAASSAQCTLAYWHHPLFTSGNYSPGVAAVKPLFQALYDYHADLVLNGHDHNYERFALQDPNGTLDSANGIREFIVGTGGRGHYSQGVPIPNSEVRDGTTFGVLELTLHPGGYEWHFVPEAGKTFTDSGSDPCEGQPNDTTPPSAPTGLTATAAGSTAVSLNWAAATDDTGVTSYEIYRDGVLLTTTASAVTSFSDTTVAPGTTYSYQVKARDAAGNVSDPSSSAPVTIPSSATLAFGADADARVEEAHATTNYGTSFLRTDGGSDPDVNSYLRFTVSGVTGAVQSAKLRLYDNANATVDGPAVYPADNVWTETTVNWTTKPPFTGPALDDKAAIASNSWVEYNVTAAVTGNGTYNFALAMTSSDGADFFSREGANAALRPQLVVTSG